MKTIKVFLASSDELLDERLQFDSLFNHLNRIFRPRGLYLELSKWEYLDSSMGPKHKQEEYNEELKTCELCLVIYWTKFGEYTGEELMTAYNELKEGRNPKKLYVFFKEPAEVSPELKAFKDSFASEYGHFYCKFENVDSMRLHFLLQLEAYNNTEIKGLVKVEDSRITVAGNPMADLDNIPFAAKNKEYRRLKDEIAKAESEIHSFESILAAGSNDAIAELLGNKRTDLYYLKEELSKHENLLFDTARHIAKKQGERISERMARAIEAFEDGRANDANIILNEALHDARFLREDINKTKELLRQQKENATLSISELMLKASVALADDTLSIEDRIAAAEELYEEAYALANECDYEKNLYLDLLREYGEFLSTYAKYDKCLKLKNEILKIKVSIRGEKHPEIGVALNNIASTYYALGQYDKTEEYMKRAMNIWQDNPEGQNQNIATGYANLGDLYFSVDKYFRALKCYKNAMKLIMADPESSPFKIASIYHDIGNGYNSIMNRAKAQEYYKKALEIWLDLLNQNPERPAIYYDFIGNEYCSLGEYRKSQEYHEKAMELRLTTLGENHPNVAVGYVNIAWQYKEAKEYDKALEYFGKALRIIIKTLGNEHPETKEINKQIDDIVNKEHNKRLFWQGILGLGVLICLLIEIIKSLYNYFSN